MVLPFTHTKAIMSKVETFKFVKEVKVVDADGLSIKEGSVLRHTKDGERGVVVKIMRPGDAGWIMDQVGDMLIRTSPSCTRVSNQYAMWRHIPRNEQTHIERYQSWFCDCEAFEYNGLKYDEGRSDDSMKAISGIMALLPNDPVCWETGPWPDTIETAFDFLLKHLSSMEEEIKTLKAKAALEKSSANFWQHYGTHES